MQIHRYMHALAVCHCKLQTHLRAADGEINIFIFFYSPSLTSIGSAAVRALRSGARNGSGAIGDDRFLPHAHPKSSQFGAAFAAEAVAVARFPHAQPRSSHWGCSDLFSKYSAPFPFPTPFVSGKLEKCIVCTVFIGYCMFGQTFSNSKFHQDTSKKELIN